MACFGLLRSWLWNQNFAESQFLWLNLCQAFLHSCRAEEWEKKLSLPYEARKRNHHHPSPILHLVCVNSNVRLQQTNNLVSAHQLGATSEKVKTFLLGSLTLASTFSVISLSPQLGEKNAVVKKLILYATKFDNLSAKCNLVLVSTFRSRL